MAYGVLYEFHRTSTNGADMLITISQKGYNGAVKKRALGRAPVIKRDNNGHIYGTSCELYAECLVDGEFSHLYTSDAYEYKVEVYKNDTLLWAGFVSPELYSEPDIAPPYDVQIIATDGLGELKNYNFNKRGVASILDHIKALMSNTGIDLGFNVVSGLRYIDENGAASAIKDILNVKLDLDHEEGNTCYDVLQGILSSLNANITQHNGSYLMFRETDFISKAGANGVEAFTATGNNINLGVASFGTMKANQWWPVGQLSTVIEPAKNQIVLKSPNHYKGNVLRFDNWTTSEMASFSEAENAYILPGANSYITQTVDFGGHQVGYRLGLRVRARNVGTATEEEQNIGLKVEMEGQTSAVGPNYWLVKPATGGRRPTSGYMWRNTESSFEEDLTTPSEAEDASDAQDIDIVLPLYREGLRAFAYAKRIKLTIFNPKGLYNIHVYDVSLVKYEQIKGYEANVTIDNMARESESDVNLTITAGDLAPAAGNVFMTGLPLRPTDSEVITKWQIGNNASQDYLAAMAFDYSRGISLPRMKYSGILNVPGSATVLPTLFLRDGTYYFPHTYSYDLYSDEITVELISISAADVSLSSVAISQSAEAVGTMGATTGGTSGGGGAVSIPRDKQMSDTSDNAVENKVIKAYVDQAKKDVEDLLASMWQLIGDRVVTDKKTVVENDLIVEGDVATGGSGGGTAAAGTVTGVLVGNDRYEDVTAGLLDLTEAFNKIDVSDQLKDYLPLSGGVLQADSADMLVINRLSSTSSAYITFKGNNSLRGRIGFDASNNPIVQDINYGTGNQTLIHAGNIGSQSVDSAKVLSTSFHENINYSPKTSQLKLIRSTDGNALTNGFPLDYVSGLSVMAGYTGWQMVTYGNWTGEPNPRFRSLGDDGNWSPWKTIAFTDSNVASATKLQTARTIWGQSFNGSANIGDNGKGQWLFLNSGGEGIYISGAAISWHNSQNTWSAGGIVFNSSGNVTIGASDSASTNYRFYVDGTANISGKTYIGSEGEAMLFLRRTNYHSYIVGASTIAISTNGSSGNIAAVFQKDKAANFLGAVSMASTLSVTGKTTISNDLVVSGDVSTGGSGESTGAAGTVTAIAVNGQTYEPTAGIVTIPDYPTSLTWSAINDRPTHLSDFTDDVVSGKYLPLSGGVLQADSADMLVINRLSSTSSAYITFKGNNSLRGRIGFDASNNPIVQDINYGTGNQTLIHAGNIGSQSVDSAKVLSTSFHENINYSPKTSQLKLIRSTDGNALTNGFPLDYVSGLSVMAGYTGWQMVTYGNWTGEPNPRFRSLGDDGNWSPWKTIAFTDSNVASATKLQTARTIWGQSFNGSANIGDNGKGQWLFLNSGGEGIYISGAAISWHNSQNTWSAGGIVFNSSGNVTIGASDSASTNYRFYVDGTANISGKTYIGSEGEAMLFLRRTNYHSYIVGASTIAISTNGSSGNIAAVFQKDKAANFLGAVSMASTLSVTGKTTISNDLVVSGDVSTGGSGGGSSSGGGDSNCLGPVELDMQSISSLGTFTQAQMDGFGLTTTVISNMLAGLYTKVIDWGGGDVYDYNGFGVIGSIIRLYFRQGNGESVDYTYTLYYDKTKWTVTEN